MLWLILVTATLVFGRALGQNYTVTINGSASHPIPSTLYGWMWEDINSGDGGLYAELLQNRAFQQVTPQTPGALYAWSAVGGASLSVVDSTVTPSLSTALPNSLRVQIPPKTSGNIGIANSGYFGINVNASWTYKGSFYYKVPVGSTVKGSLTASLASSSGVKLASASVTIRSNATGWTQVQFSFKPKSTPSDTNNVFSVTVDGASTAGQTIYFALFSLFPPTYKNRPNGMRLDLARVLADGQPGVFRFPGGSNLGQSIAGRWNWRNAVGPLTNRPGRLGNWGYINTDGLGLKECLDFAEDLGMTSIMAIWDGYAADGETVPENQLAQYIQEAADQINFVIGDPAKSEPAALRASLGHPKPYPIAAVEVGNEDFFASDTYAAYRWRDFVGNLSVQFPNVQFMATTWIDNPVLNPKAMLYDLHQYSTPTWFAQNSFQYDYYPRDGRKYFAGEYAAISTDPNNLFGSPSQGRMLWPTIEGGFFTSFLPFRIESQVRFIGSVGEAAYMTGLERNADIVFAAAYAPLLQNIANYQWTPNLIGFDAGTVYKSTSYYVQKMFSLNKGDEYLPSTIPSQSGTVFWSVTRRTATKEVLIKIANTNGTPASLTFNLPYATVHATGTATVLTGAQTAGNSPSAPDSIVPTTTKFNAGKTFTYNAAGWSVDVLSVVAY
ncbi:glycoside hydrolase family 51 protein [Rickenella mellea]|uniref:non-reducing end alpha-L-arabinofuranosidase n=1 Tax=Rickenella mellea TaxID=50990 RepID=A0A4Y7QHQ6_9AGAM|nr:glycoside hydrolase family 51 protein [Rickenella mellea]